MKSEKYYNDNIQTLDVSELRTFNRYFLHPKGKRACNQCRLVWPVSVVAIIFLQLFEDIRVAVRGSTVV